ncbi:MAG: oligogalacturonate lyase family protein [Planctomycetes bacterium]|nr:oligogalacturonate lyase family protein [Planctomycetota bacterium]
MPGPTTKPPASMSWHNESGIVGDEEVLFQPRFADCENGVEVLKLTNLPVVSTHIYPEAPISSPDGKRFVWSRWHPSTGQRALWIADLETLRIRQITDEPGAAAPIITPDGKWWYYSVGRAIWRMHPESYERELWYTVPESMGNVGSIVSISHCGTRVVGSANPAPGRHGVISTDLLNRTSTIAYEHPDARNPHVQYSRDDRRALCVQQNDGIEFDAAGNLTRLVGDNGASLWVVNDDGTNPQKLNVGSSPLERVQGHQCWVGGEHRVITTTHRRTAVGKRWLQHWIIAIAPGEKEGRVVGDGSKEDIHFTHMHTTRDGRYWVSDCNRTAKIYVGSLRTGRFRRFCDSNASFGAPQHTHPHPFFMADGKTIGWNSDVTGVPQIYVARIPDGFLDELDRA